MPPDSTETKRRILAAARQEFAEFGLAGARIDRVAEHAAANKRSIYAHFGPKEHLFDLVVADALTTMAGDVQFNPDDLADYAGRLFDYLLAHPATLRLTVWANLERPTTTTQEAQTYRTKTEALRGQYGDHAVDVLVLVLGLVTAWFSASPALTSDSSITATTSQTMTSRRTLMVQSVAAMTAPLRRQS
ncbi:TetR/AcrR family transcriptional regulator [Mycobacteroides chelonae]|uniref:TetR/AcrR family transcriptional regulator n=1 Tax=Mycobacteroides chelonae TaxID=1774 RepID=UPI0008A9645C|nr:TetR family transcriptional regulator [Mycobacteroides chelonae]AYM43191.1 TetR/AcrR family transcriptional regulator [[Mycobacterium] chelonae subsp. gwanakae]OHU14550.1 TetR family transcriptional regulator [Mycobacteroides chelonae]